MARRRKDLVRIEGVPGVALGEEALHALRHGPLSMHVAYLLGTVPFMLGLVFFWFDMSQNAQASLSIVPASIGMTVLFVWMKVWHVIFSGRVRDYLSGRDPRPWTWTRVWSIFHRQSFAHALGLVVMPVAFVLMIPFPICHAFFYSLCVVDDDASTADARSIWGRAWRNARLWKAQNLKAMWLFSPWLLGSILSVALFTTFLMSGNDGFLDAMAGRDFFTWIGFAFVLVCFAPVSPLGVLIAVNIAGGLGFGASLMTSFFGVQTALGTSGPWGYMNSGFVIVVFCLCYLIMDPIMRTVYVLRAYYGDSIVSGEAVKSDLLMHRRRFRKTAMRLSVIALLWVGNTTVQGAQTPDGFVEQQTLDDAIDRTLLQRKYQWREAEEPVFETSEPDGSGSVGDDNKDPSEKTPLERVREWIDDLQKRFEAWLNRRNANQTPPTRAPTPLGGGASFFEEITIGGWSILVVLVAAALVGLYLLVSKNRRLRVQALPGDGSLSTVEALPDVSDESVTADALPSDEWMKMGDDYLAKGDVRLALRAYVLATLSALAFVNVIRLARHKSNGDYGYEVQRGLRDRQELVDAFAQNIRQLESNWYGDHGVDQTALAVFRENLNRIMMYVRTRTAD